MVFVQKVKVKGITYVYLNKAIRTGKKTQKVSKFLGRESDFSKIKLDEEIKKFVVEADTRTIFFLVNQAKKKYPKLEFSLTFDEVKKIEEMNLKYKGIRKILDKKDWDDIKKRFVANFVFESNALEGNSLTLRNFSEIVFEDRIVGAKDLREVYDAKNSYEVFSKLFTSKREITEEFILDLHRRIMKNIDNRAGYKKIPNIILGRTVELTEPKEVPLAMKRLLAWYDEHKGKMYPLELAFKFHQQFEKIHPFADGNGRVGRMLLNYILIKAGYYPIIIRKTHRNHYLKALQAADIGRYVPLMRFALEKAKETYRKFFEVYYGHIGKL